MQGLANSESLADPSTIREMMAADRDGELYFSSSKRVCTFSFFLSFFLSFFFLISFTAERLIFGKIGRGLAPRTLILLVDSLKAIKIDEN